MSCHRCMYVCLCALQAVSEHDMNTPFGRVPEYWDLRCPPYSYMLTFI